MQSTTRYYSNSLPITHGACSKSRHEACPQSMNIRLKQAGHVGSNFCVARVKQCRPVHGLVMMFELVDPLGSLSCVHFRHETLDGTTEGIL